MDGLALGADFSRVRVHQGPSSAALASELSARAFTVGRDIFFGAGEFRPAVASGRRLIAHELAHVVQQTRSNGGEPILRRLTDEERNTQTTHALERAMEMLGEAKQELYTLESAPLLEQRLGEAGATKSAEEQQKIIKAKADDMARRFDDLRATLEQWKSGMVNPGSSGKWNRLVKYGTARCRSNVDAANVVADQELHVCDSFFSLPRSDTQALTLIHEAAHSLMDNEFLDIYNHERLFRYLAETPGDKAKTNPDTIAALVAGLVRSARAKYTEEKKAADHKELASYSKSMRKKMEKEADPEARLDTPTDDELSDVPVLAQSSVGKAIAWAEAKFIATEELLDRAKNLRGPYPPKNAPDDSRMMSIFKDAAEGLGVAVLEPAWQGQANFNFADDAFAAVESALRDLSEIFGKPVKARVNDNPDLQQIQWRDKVLRWPAWMVHVQGSVLPLPPIVLYSPVHLSTQILIAMLSTDSERERLVKFMDTLFKADGRQRGKLAMALSQPAKPRVKSPRSATKPPS